jgi:hypothetical protein
LEIAQALPTVCCPVLTGMSDEEQLPEVLRRSNRQIAA